MWGTGACSKLRTCPQYHASGYSEVKSCGDKRPAVSRGQIRSASPDRLPIYSYLSKMAILLFLLILLFIYLNLFKLFILIIFFTFNITCKHVLIVKDACFFD
jgi:hypothetical protein